MKRKAEKRPVIFRKQKPSDLARRLCCNWIKGGECIGKPIILGPPGGAMKAVGGKPEPVNGKCSLIDSNSKCDFFERVVRI